MSRTYKAITTAIVSGLGLATLAAMPANAADLSLNVEGINQQEGRLMIALFQGEDGFDAFKPAQANAVDVSGSTMTVSFPDLEPGEYAIRMFQDVNGDYQLNLGEHGIPSEPWGFSRDAEPEHGPASWTASSFTIADGENSQTIHLQSASK